MGAVKISVLINTFNEEKNIARCLETVRWADEVIVVDMHSDDGTVEIARGYTDKIFFFDRMGYADPARQFALDRAANKWILVVDADEIVPAGMRDRLLKIAAEDAGDVVYLPVRNYFFGRLMKGGGWGPLQDAQPRYFKKGFVRFTGRVHDYYEIDAGARICRVGDPGEGFIHFVYRDIEHFLNKLNAYTTIEAGNIAEGVKPRLGLTETVARKAVGVFFQRYLLQGGYRDGFIGFYVALLRSAVYHLSTYAKVGLLRQYAHEGPAKEIDKQYAAVADAVMAEYAAGSGAPRTEGEELMTVVFRRAGP